MKIKRKKRFDIICFTTILLLILVGCRIENQNESSFYQESNSKKFDDLFYLVEYDTVALPLDSLTGFDHNSISYFEDENQKGKLSILNTINNTVYIYDYEGRSILKKIKIATEGPESVGSIGYTTGHFMNNIDSLYVLNYRTRKMFLLKPSGKIQRVYNLKIENEDIPPIPFLKTNTPIQRVGNEFFITCTIPFVQIDDFSQFFTTLRVDLESGSIKRCFPLPEIYDQGYWSYAEFKYQPSVLYDTDTKNFLVSYPVDPYIHKYSIDGVFQGKFYVGSKYFGKIEPVSFDESLKFEKPDYDRDKIYARTESDFSYLLHDDMAQKYLRMAYVRPSEKDYQQGNTMPLTSFIIFNDEFVKIGETLLTDDYASHIYFINERGLHIAKRSSYRENEDLLTFGVFKIVEKNEDKLDSFTNRHSDD